jgi:hypothetical protein
MAKSILINEFHISFRMQSGLPAAHYAAAARTLRSRRFNRRLREVIGTMVRHFPTLQSVKAEVSC